MVMNETQSIHDKIKNDIIENRILLFMKGNKEVPQCGFSARVIYILSNLGVDYTTRDVLLSDELRQGIKDFSNWPTVPQLYIDGEFIGGCDIISELFENGELEKKLVKA
jgi:monothiol glutaredoxin